MERCDNKPPIYEKNSDGSYTYRWDIKEIQAQNNENEKDPISGWECYRIAIWPTITREKLTEAAISSLWDSAYEAKLINDYNAAKEGDLDDDTQLHIDRYKDFLSKRKALKDHIKLDCIALNII